VISSLLAARRISIRWRWVLAGQAIAAVVALAALGAHLEGWIMQALHARRFLAARQAGSQLLTEFSVWLAPFLDLVPSLPRGWDRCGFPCHTGGSGRGVGRAGRSAVLLGLLGNALLLRAPRGAASSLADLERRRQRKTAE